MAINEELKVLLDAATKEEQEYVDKKGELGVAVGERDTAKTALTEKQTAVDALVESTGTEKSEYVSALQSLVVKIEEIIAGLSA